MVHAASLDQSLALARIDYTHYRSCAGYAWINRHRPHLVPADAVHAADRREQARRAVVALALDLYPGGVAIDTGDIDAALIQTAAAVAAGANVIYGATVKSERGLLATADILVRQDDGWILADVKATATVKGEHVSDVAFQAIAFAEAGFEISGMTLILLRKAYRRAGIVQPGALLERHDVTARVRRKLPAVSREVASALSSLQDPERPAPCLCDMGTRTQRCPTFAHFHPGAPNGGSVYDLGSIRGDQLGQVIVRGITDLADWPDDIPISARQRRQIDVHRRGAPHVDTRLLRAFLDRLEYPLHFLDYETFQTAIPLFDGCRPWAQIPFQYSLHVLSKDGTCEHRQFLWTEPGRFPVPALLDQARQDIGPHGSVVVWNRGFEESRNREMAEIMPGAAAFLHDVNARMVDLMDVVRLGMWDDPAFQGSASLKKVLPVVDPDLSYTSLAIGDGAQAAERWFDAVLGDPAAMDAEEREAVFAALLRYCHLDTLGMVRILRHLQALAREMPLR